MTTKITSTTFGVRVNQSNRDRIEADVLHANIPDHHIMLTEDRDLAVGDFLVVVETTVQHGDEDEALVVSGIMGVYSQAKFKRLFGKTTKEWPGRYPIAHAVKTIH